LGKCDEALRGQSCQCEHFHPEAAAHSDPEQLLGNYLQIGSESADPFTILFAGSSRGEKETGSTPHRATTPAPVPTKPAAHRQTAPTPTQNPNHREPTAEQTDANHHWHTTDTTPPTAAPPDQHPTSAPAPTRNHPTTTHQHWPHPPTPAQKTCPSRPFRRHPA
ncbi:hypothetical protein, partial [Mycobacterium persicum]|uniref:hypothetical protein n=1 Tax=Mycobacterium persicum TaxID=1487726 RepID=UPI003F5DB730